jgi:hypothetical protein
MPQRVQTKQSKVIFRSEKKNLHAFDCDALRPAV